MFKNISIARKTQACFKVYKSGSGQLRNQDLNMFVYSPSEKSTKLRVLAK